MGTMVAVFKQVGMDASDSEVLKMSVNTSDSWCAQSFSTRPGMLSGPAALRGLIPLRVLLTSAVDTLKHIGCITRPHSVTVCYYIVYIMYVVYFYYFRYEENKLFICE